MIAKDTAPKRVGGERNAHGTRLTRRIACDDCKVVDYISVHTNKSGLKLCRVCAGKVLQAFEVGVQLPSDKKPVTCSRCACAFSVSPRLLEKEDLMCSDCLNGFDVWRGSIARGNTSAQPTRFQVRASGTLLRSRI